MNNKFIHTLDKWYIYLAWAAAAVLVWVWAVSAVVVFQMIFALNNGILRSFFVLASAGGMLLWRTLAGDHIVRVITAVVRLIVRPFARVRMWLRKSKTDSIKKT